MEQALLLALGRGVGLDSPQADKAQIESLERFSIADDGSSEWQYAIDLIAMLLDVLRGQEVAVCLRNALSWYLDGTFNVLSNELARAAGRPISSRRRLEGSRKINTGLERSTSSDRCDAAEEASAGSGLLRIGGLGDFFLTHLLDGGHIKGRHASKLRSPLYLSFMLGISLGLLDQLGEIPSATESTSLGRRRYGERREIRRCPLGGS